MKSVPVYSSERGALCPGCGEPTARCLCRARAAVPRGDGVVRVSRETKGRNGKAVTLVAGVPLDDKGLALLAKDLKQRCGSGGTVKEGVIEIQGDHRERLVEELRARGLNVKGAGGRVSPA